MLVVYLFWLLLRTTLGPESCAELVNNVSSAVTEVHEGSTEMCYQDKQIIQLTDSKAPLEQEVRCSCYIRGCDSIAPWALFQLPW